MIARFLLILGSLFIVGLVGAFVLYVSLLTIVTAIAVLIGLIATLALGYWAGSTSTHERPQSAKRIRDAPVINALGDASSWPIVPYANVQTRLSLVFKRGHEHEIRQADSSR